MNTITIETPLGTKFFKIGDIVKASKEGRSLSMLGNGIRMRITNIVDHWRVRVQIMSNTAFTYTQKQEYKEIPGHFKVAKTSMHYEKDVLKLFEFIIGAQYLEKIKIKPVHSNGFNF